MAIPFEVTSIRNLAGIQTKTDIIQKALNEAEWCQNGFFDVKGSFLKRKGGERVFQTSIGKALDGVYQFRYANDSVSRLLFTTEDDLYLSSGTPSSLHTFANPSTFPSFYSQYNPYGTDYCFIQKRGNEMLKYDGTTVTQAGITRPSSAPTVAAGAGGSLPVGVYLVRYTYVRDSGGDEIEESNPSDVDTVTLTGGNQTINISGMTASSDPQVTDKYIYLTTADQTDLFLVGSVSNATTTFSISVPPVYGRSLEYDHDLPPEDLLAIGFWQNRFYGFGTEGFPNRLYFSKNIDVWYWPTGELDQATAQYIDIGQFPIRAAVTYFDSILVFSDFQCWSVEGDGSDVSNYTVRSIKYDEIVGCSSSRGAYVCNNYCYFIHTSGIFRTDGTTIARVSNPVDLFFTSQQQQYLNPLIRLDKDLIKNAVVVEDKTNYGLLWFAANDVGAGENNTGLCMSTLSMKAENGVIKPDWNPWLGFNTNCACSAIENGEVVWYRGDSFGYLYLEQRIFGDGAEITSDVTSATSTTLTDTMQTWTVNAFTDLYVIISNGLGFGQVKRISSNTTDTLTVDSPWDVVPDTTSEYSIGGIDWWYEHSWNDYDVPELSKDMLFFRPFFSVGGNFTIKTQFGFDFIVSDFLDYDINLNFAFLWDGDDALWDESTWDAIAVSIARYPIPQDTTHLYSTIIVRNAQSGIPIVYNGLDKVWHRKGLRGFFTDGL